MTGHSRRVLVVAGTESTSVIQEELLNAGFDTITVTYPQSARQHVEQNGMPHLLIGGTTGSGKSVCLRSIATCLATNNTPDRLRMVMIDPKMVELIRFNGLPHLLGRVEVQLDRILGVLRDLGLDAWVGGWPAGLDTVLESGGGERGDGMIRAVDQVLELEPRALPNLPHELLA